ncbi:hypothetical protein [Candidatus Cardinium hertigii]|uniref:hypothetical protein n=1 Tax=Candidatus Cardinium hertigii TaxID=247481 RepID=UPI003D7C7F1A
MTVLNITTAYLGTYYIIPSVLSSIAVSVGPMLHNLTKFNKTLFIEKLLSILLFIATVCMLLSDRSVVMIRKSGLNMIIGFSLSLSF